MKKILELYYSYEKQQLMKWIQDKNVDQKDILKFLVVIEKNKFIKNKKIQQFTKQIKTKIIQKFLNSQKNIQFKKLQPGYFSSSNNQIVDYRLIQRLSSSEYFISFNQNSDQVEFQILRQIIKDLLIKLTKAYNNNQQFNELFKNITDPQLLINIITKSILHIDNISKAAQQQFYESIKGLLTVLMHKKDSLILQLILLIQSPIFWKGFITNINQKINSKINYRIFFVQLIQNLFKRKFFKKSIYLIQHYQNQKYQTTKTNQINEISEKIQIQQESNVKQIKQINKLNQIKLNIEINQKLKHILETCYLKIYNFNSSNYGSSNFTYNELCDDPIKQIIIFYEEYRIKPIQERQLFDYQTQLYNKIINLDFTIQNIQNDYLVLKNSFELVKFIICIQDNLQYKQNIICFSIPKEFQFFIIKMLNHVKISQNNLITLISYINSIINYEEYEEFQEFQSEIQKSVKYNIYIAMQKNYLAQKVQLMNVHSHNLQKYLIKEQKINSLSPINKFLLSKTYKYQLIYLLYKDTGNYYIYIKSTLQKFLQKNNNFDDLIQIFRLIQLNVEFGQNQNILKYQLLGLIERQINKSFIRENKLQLFKLYFDFSIKFKGRMNLSFLTQNYSIVKLLIQYFIQKLICQNNLNLYQKYQKIIEYYFYEYSMDKFWLELIYCQFSKSVYIKDTKFNLRQKFFRNFVKLFQISSNQLEQLILTLNQQIIQLKNQDIFIPYLFPSNQMLHIVRIENVKQMKSQNKVRLFQLKCRNITNLQMNKNIFLKNTTQYISQFQCTNFIKESKIISQYPVYFIKPNCLVIQSLGQTYISWRTFIYKIPQIKKYQQQKRLLQQKNLKPSKLFDQKIKMQPKKSIFNKLYTEQLFQTHPINYQEWIKKVKTFHLSYANISVVTYLLKLADRHQNNLYINNNYELSMIDFETAFDRGVIVEHKQRTFFRADDCLINSLGKINVYALFYHEFLIKIDELKKNPVTTSRSIQYMDLIRKKSVKKRLQKIKNYQNVRQLLEGSTNEIFRKMQYLPYSP